MKEYVARYAKNIEADIERNWSSWNFGENGFKGTREELDKRISEITDSLPFSISGFEIYPGDLRNSEFGELYENYWVLIDRVNAREGLSCLDLESTNLEDAIEEAKELSYTGEGSSFDARDGKLVYSKDDIHIFEFQ